MKYCGPLKDRVSVNSDLDEVQERCRLGQALSLDTYGHHLSPVVMAALAGGSARQPRTLPKQASRVQAARAGGPVRRGVEAAEEQRNKRPRSVSTGSVLVARLLVALGPS